jgi:hypothetical protein
MRLSSSSALPKVATPIRTTAMTHDTEQVAILAIFPARGHGGRDRPTDPTIHQQAKMSVDRR